MSRENRVKWLWWLGGLLLVAGIILVWWLAVGQPDTQQSQEQETANNQSATEPLEAALSNLTPGQTLTGTHTLTIDISEPSRVERVEYYIDDLFAGVTYALPFSFALKTAELSEGEHTVGARVYDTDGNDFNTPDIIFNVKHSSEEVNDDASTGGGQSSANLGGTAENTPPSNPGNDNGGGSTPPDPDPDPDTTPPSAPTNLVVSADDGYTTNLSWVASTDNVAITSYRVFRDGVLLGDAASANTTTYQDQTVVPGNTYDYTVKAVDANNNISADSNEPNITLEPTSIWIDGDTPWGIDTDPSPVELGVKFRPLVDGHVSGVRFYKGAGNVGTHVGSLWSSDGNIMADVTFSGETASGWQTASFDTPVAVTAGTTYVVSYSAPNGNISYASNYFTTAGITSQYLTALASGVDGNNGVYSPTLGTFPSSSFGNTNYWVDATFIPNLNAGGPTPKTQDNSVVYPGFPGSNNTGVPVGKRLPVRDRGIVAAQDGSIIEDIEINDEVTVQADNTTIKNSKINNIVYLDTDLAGSADWFVTIEDSEIDAGTRRRGVVSLGQLSIVRSNLHGGQSSVVCVRNCTVEDSWIHGQYLPDDEDWHLNGFLSNGGTNMTMRGNTFSCDHANNLVGGGCSADISLFADFDAITDVTIDGNLLTANPHQGYCLAAGHSAGKPFGANAANIIVTNNVFQRGDTSLCGGAGPVTDFYIGGSPAPGSVWSGNVWSNGGTVDPS